MINSDTQTLAAREAIREALYRYCRALDRMDREMALAVWHADGSACYHGMFEGSGQQFVDWVWQAHQAMERHSHQISNVLIELDGDRASSEACVSLLLWSLPDENGQQTEIAVRGRYLDRWSLRAGRWAIDAREHIVDLYSTRPLERGPVSDGSRRDLSDPSFQYIPAAGQSGQTRP